jgi:hypothetical protein
VDEGSRPVKRRSIGSWLAAALCAASLQARAADPASNATPAAPAPALFPALERAGRVPVSVTCSEGTRGAQWVSFGMPFPRGFLADAGLVSVKSEAGEEVPADATELARWRHFRDDAQDGTSIRSVLLTFGVSCTGEADQTYLVEWGVKRARQAASGVTPANVAARWQPQAPPRRGEHQAVDNYASDTLAPPVREPAVWATLPSAWLMKQNLRGPVAPIRDRRFSDHLKGYLRTYVNDVDADVTRADANAEGKGYVTWGAMVEGWLYDRPLTLWSMYINTGDAAWQRRAHRASQFYASWIALDAANPPYARGSFRKKPPTYDRDDGDPKYSYAGGLMAAYLLSGDARLLEPIKAVAEFVGKRVQTRLFPYQRTHGLWTERQLTVALSAAMYAYEATGQPVFKRQVAMIVDGMKSDVSNPPAGYPGAAVMAGVLLHRPEVHEGDALKDSLIMSPWMSALLGDALWHYYVMSGDTVALQFLSSYAQFIAQHGIYNVADDPHLGRYWAVWYTAGTARGYTDDGIWADIEHAPDTLALLAKGRWARRQLGQPTELIELQMERLKQTSEFAMARWVRDTPGAPRYRATPMRKVGWWFVNSFDLGWFGVY